MAPLQDCRANWEPGKTTSLCRSGSELGHEIPNSRYSPTKAEPNISADDTASCHPEFTEVGESLRQHLHCASVGATEAGLPIMSHHPCVQGRIPSTDGSSAGHEHTDSLDDRSSGTYYPSLLCDFKQIIPTLSSLSVKQRYYKAENRPCLLPCHTPHPSPVPPSIQACSSLCAPLSHPALCFFTHAVPIAWHRLPPTSTKHMFILSTMYLLGFRNIAVRAGIYPEAPVAHH